MGGGAVMGKWCNRCRGYCKPNRYWIPSGIWEILRYLKLFQRITKILQIYKQFINGFSNSYEWFCKQLTNSFKLTWILKNGFTSNSHKLIPNNSFRYSADFFQVFNFTENNKSDSYSQRIYSNWLCFDSYEQQSTTNSFCLNSCKRFKNDLKQMYSVD